MDLFKGLQFGNYFGNYIKGLFGEIIKRSSVWELSWELIKGTSIWEIF